MRYRLLLVAWLLTDLVLFIGSYLLAYFLRVGWILSSDFPVERFLWAAGVAAPGWLLVLATTRAFSITRNQRSLRNAAYTTYAALVGVALFSLVYYFRFKTSFQGLSRLLLLEAFVLTSLIPWGWHMVFDLCQRIILRKHPPTFPTLIVGVTRESRKLVSELKRKKSPLTPVAILDGQGVKEQNIDGVPVRGRLDKLEETLMCENITHLIQCSNLEQTVNLLSACRTHGITYMLLPSVLGIVESDERVESLEGYSVTVVRPPKSSWFTLL